MKQVRFNVWLMRMTGCLLCGCSQPQQDKEIKADIATKAKTTYAFAGVSYTVAGGVVSLAGNCPTPKQKQEVENTVGKIAGVKNVSSAIAIAPVVLDESFTLKQQVDSVLKNYSGVTAQVTTGKITLSGVMPAADAAPLTTAVKQLSGAEVISRLTIQ